MKNTRELSTIELDEVSGGNCGHTAYDSMFLKELGLMNESYSTFTVAFDWIDSSAAVDDGWARIGIICCTHYGGLNEYFYNGKSINRKEAYEIAMEKTGIRVDLDNYM